MTHYISDAPFFSLVPDVLSLIMMQLPVAQLDATSLACKKFFELSREALLNHCLTSFNNPDIADAAKVMALKHFKSLRNDQQLEIIQHIIKPILKFNHCSSLLPYCPQAQKPAEDAAAAIKDDDERSKAYFSLFKTTKNIDHLNCAAPNANTFKDVLKRVKSLKLKFNACIGAETAVRQIQNEAFAITQKFIADDQLPYYDKVKLILKCADLSPNPADSIKLATKLYEDNKTQVESKFQINYTPMRIELAKLKFSPSKDYTNCLNIVIERNPTDYSARHGVVMGALKKTCRLDLNLARALADCFYTNYYEDGKLEAYKSIFKESKDFQDLIAISKLSPKYGSYWGIKQVLKAALHRFQEIPIARTLALKHINHDHLFEQNYRKCQSFMNIYLITKDIEDLKQAEQYMTMIYNTAYKIRACRKLFKITNDDKYKQQGIKLYEKLLREGQDVEQGLIQLSLLTNEKQYLQQAFDKENHDRFGFKIPEIVYVCLDHFRDFELANEFLQRLYENTEAPIWNTGTLVDYSKKLIATKKFDEARLIDQYVSRYSDAKT